MSSATRVVDATKLTFLVLCGGQGTRMGGREKPLLPWRGKPLIDWVLASKPQGAPALISANRHLDEYAKRGKVITDARVLDEMDPDAEAFERSSPVKGGPLIGVLGGLRHCKTEWLVVAPGDTPNLPDDWVQRLWTGREARSLCAVAHDGRRQHLHLLLHASVADDLNAFLRKRGYRVHEWVTSLNPTVVRFPEADAFLNVNSPNDLT